MPVASRLLPSTLPRFMLAAMRECGGRGVGGAAAGARADPAPTHPCRCLDDSAVEVRTAAAVGACTVLAALAAEAETRAATAIGRPSPPPPVRTFLPRPALAASAAAPSCAAADGSVRCWPPADCEGGPPLPSLRLVVLGGCGERAGGGAACGRLLYHGAREPSDDAPLGQGLAGQGALPSVCERVELLEKVLVLAALEPARGARLATLQALSPPLDVHLQQPRLVELLLPYLEMGDYALCSAALAVLGRLAERNPGEVVPALRTFLLSLLTQMTHAHSPAARQQAARLLSRLSEARPVPLAACTARRPGTTRVHHTRRVPQARPQLLGSHATPIVLALTPLLGEADAGVATAALAALGELAGLAELAGAALTPYVPQLLPALHSLLQDLPSGEKPPRHAHDTSETCPRLFP